MPTVIKLKESSLLQPHPYLRASFRLSTLNNYYHPTFANHQSYLPLLTKQNLIQFSTFELSSSHRMSDAWFTWHIAPDGDSEDGCDREEAGALKDYIHSATVTPETVARRIILPVTNESETLRKGQSSNNLFRLWSLIIDPKSSNCFRRYHRYKRFQHPIARRMMLNKRRYHGLLFQIGAACGPI